MGTVILDMSTRMLIVLLLAIYLLYSIGYSSYIQYALSHYMFALTNYLTHLHTLLIIYTMNLIVVV